MELYVKASFDSKEGAGYFSQDGIDEMLYVGMNAFDDLEDALEAANDGDTIVLLDKTVSEKLEYLYANGAITVKGGKRDEYEGTQTSEVTLNLTGALDDMPLELSTINFDLFKSVKIVNAYVGNISGGDIIDSEKDNGNGTGKWVDEYKAVGKAHIGDDSNVQGEIIGFNEVVLEDDAVVDGYIAATTQSNSGGYKEEESSTIDQTKADISGTYAYVATNKPAGSAKITEAIAGGLVGYSTVTISDGSEIGSVYRGLNSVNSYKATYSTKYGVVTKVEENSTVYTASGTLTATDSYISGEISNYSTVTLTNTSSGFIMRDMLVKNSAKNTYTLMDGWGDYAETLSMMEMGEFIYEIEDPTSLNAKDVTFESKAAGSVTLKIDGKTECYSLDVGGIYGYANVTATGYDKNDDERYISTGEIFGGEVKLTAKYDVKYSWGGDWDLLTHNIGKWTEEYKASGSVKLKTNVYTMGYIQGYNSVELSDSVTVDGGVWAAGSNLPMWHMSSAMPEYMPNFYPMGEFGSYKSERSVGVKWDTNKVSGTDSKVTTYKAASSFKASDEVTVNGGIYGYSAVTLSEAEVYGGDIERDKDEVVTIKYTYSGNADKVTRVADKTIVVNASGKVTATGLNGMNTIEGSIRDYKDVALTNISQVGEITRKMLAKDASKSTSVFNSFSEAEMFYENDYGMLEGEEYYGFWDYMLPYQTAQDSTYESKAAGAVTLKVDAKNATADMTTGTIKGYANVTATGYDDDMSTYSVTISGDIIGSEIKTTAKYDIAEDLDGMPVNIGKWVSEYKAAGSVKLKTEVTVGDIEDEENSGRILGYNSVELSDSVTVGGVQAAGGDMAMWHEMMNADMLPEEFGSYKVEKNLGIKWTSDKVSGTDSKVTTVKAASSFKASDDVLVKNNVIGYGTVSLAKNSTVKGYIYLGQDSVNSYKVTYAGNTAKVTVTEDYSVVNNASGSLTATDSAIVGSINNYKTVSLTNTNADYIWCAMQTKNASKKSYVFENAFESAYMDYQMHNVDWMSPDMMGMPSEVPLTSEDTTIESKAAGSITLKIDAKTDEYSMYVGRISGYANVTATGYDKGMDEKSISIDGSIFGGEIKETDKVQNGTGKWVDEYKASGSVKLKTNITAGDIMGYNSVELADSVSVGMVQANGYNQVMEHYMGLMLSESPDDLPEFFGSCKEEDSQNVKVDYNKISGTNSSVTTIKAASSFKAEDEVDVGGIYGYSTVTLKDDAWVSGEINRGKDEVITQKATYSTANGEVTRVMEITEVYNASGSVTATASDITGDITDYKTVTLTNADAGNIARSMSAKTTTKVTTSLGSVESVINELVMNEIDIDDIMGNESSNEYTVERKAAGSVTLKIDSKLSDAWDMYVGDIYGYASVTATGYDNGKFGYDEIEYFINIGMGDGITGGETKEIIKDDIRTYEAKAAGSVTLKTNVCVNGDIFGYSTVALSDSVEVNGNISGGNIVEDMAKTVYTAAGKVTLSDDVVVMGNITGFKDVSAQESAVVLGSIIGGNNEDRNVRAVTQLGTAVGTLDFKNSQIGMAYAEKCTVAGFKTVKLTYANVYGDIDCLGTKGSAVTLDDCKITGEIKGAQQVNVKKWAEIDGYAGTAYDDTFTVAAKTVLEFTGSNLDFGEGKDKFVVDGTVIMYEEVDFNAIGLESMTGKGCIAVTAANYNPSNILVGSSVELINLGATVDGFHGKDKELADNTQSKAVVADWDVEGYYLEHEGWLGVGAGLSFEDNCDWIKFKADRDGMLSFGGLGENDEITVNGKKLAYGDAYEVSAGMDYIVSITRVEENSTHYSMMLA